MTKGAAPRSSETARSRPFVFFAHHQGRGHANRIMAIAEHLDRECYVLTARPDMLRAAPPNVNAVALPDMIGAQVPTERLFAEKTPSVLHCVPLGVAEMRGTMRAILDTLDDVDPALFVVDVSSEIALLARIASVPAVTVRMHGDRADPGHLGAYEASVGMLAPFDRAIEQADYPDWAAAKTFYTGGLCTTSDPVLERDEARARLDLPADRRIVLTVTGGGGSGTPYAPLTVGARANGDALWLVAGPVAREGHETDFANLRELGWVDNLNDHICAADVVIASAGDNTVHEIARVGRPYICVPEWRYHAEQKRKADELARVGAALALDHWPGDIAAWRDALDRAGGIDLDAQRALFDADAAKHAADWLNGLAAECWDGPPPANPPS